MANNPAETKRKILQGRRFVDLSDECGSPPAPTTSLEATSNKVILVSENLEQEILLSNQKSTVLPADTSLSNDRMISLSVSASPEPVLKELERQAHVVAGRLDDALLEFGGSLAGAARLTADCSDAYGQCSVRTCDAADATVRATYQMLARSEELLRGLKGTLPPLAKQIKEIKRLLDLFESHMQKSQG